MISKNGAEYTEKKWSEIQLLLEFQYYWQFFPSALYKIFATVYFSIIEVEKNFDTADGSNTISPSKNYIFPLSLLK
jgi:hypothetical protein